MEKGEALPFPGRIHLLFSFPIVLSFIHSFIDGTCIPLTKRESGGDRNCVLLGFESPVFTNHIVITQLNIYSAELIAKQ